MRLDSTCHGTDEELVANLEKCCHVSGLAGLHFLAQLDRQLNVILKGYKDEHSITDKWSR